MTDQIPPIREPEHPLTNVKYRISIQRINSIHHRMKRIAGDTLSPGNTEGNLTSEKEKDVALTAMAMCALGIEALANTLLSVLFPAWEDFDNLSPWGKLRLACDQMRAPLDPGVSPGQSVKELLRLRNQFAHGKPQKLTSEPIEVDADDYSEAIAQINLPDAKVDESLTLAKARQFLKAFDDIIAMINNHLEHEIARQVTSEAAHPDIKLQIRPAPVVAHTSASVGQVLIRDGEDGAVG